MTNHTGIHPIRNLKAKYRSERQYPLTVHSFDPKTGRTTTWQIR